VTIAIIFVALSTKAQLANTRWKGTLNVENGLDAVFNFHNDTLEVSGAESGEDLETMSYNTTDSVLTLVKLYGQSQCDTTAGRYKYAIENNVLTLSVISDECPDRSQAIGTMKLEKVD
jgi:hypothetical protein